MNASIPLKLIAVPDALDPDALALAADAAADSTDDDSPRAGDWDYCAERAIVAYLTKLAESQATRGTEVVDNGDYLMIYMPLPNARLRLNRFDDQPFYVEAVEYGDGQTFEVTGDGGFSPPLCDDVIEARAKAALAGFAAGDPS